MKKNANNSLSTAAIGELAQKIGLPEDSLPLLMQAMTHPAYFEGGRHAAGDNQRLEFLGDAVLDMFVGEYLYHEYPQAQEGVLSKMRAYIVCEASLAEDGLLLGLDKTLLLGRGSESSGDRHRPSVIADAYEALIGAIFVSCGAEKARQFVLERLRDKMDHITPDEYEDKKSSLQELVQARVSHGVYYRLLSSSGPDHAPTFESAVFSGKMQIGVGVGRSKKESEVAAAAQALANRGEWLDRID